MKRFNFYVWLTGVMQFVVGTQHNIKELILIGSIMVVCVLLSELTRAIRKRLKK